MRFLRLLLSAALTSNVAYGMIPSAKYLVSAVDRTQQTNQLQLTTSIVDQKYCAADYLRLTLKLHYTNLSSRPIILYKYSMVIDRQMISRDVQAAAAKHYEEDVSPMVHPIGMQAPLDGPMPSPSVFVILMPGETYDVETQAHLPFLYDGTNDIDESLTAGDHILQVRVRTWYESRQQAATLRRRWIEHGHLWSEGVVSSPMPFRIERNRLLVTCS
jgi:hypothetical protein